MDLIPWTEEYLTGLDEIDNDHRMLFALVNDLNISLGCSPDRSKVSAHENRLKKSPTSGL